MDNLTLMCVEDDLESQKDIVYLLKKYFKNIYTASDGEEALKVYKNKKPNIILLDINIPKLNGLDVASKIRESDITTPIIFLTAHSEKNMLLQAIDLQVSSYIIKPFKIEELKETIFKIIDKVGYVNLKLENNFSWNDETSELYYKEKQVNVTKNEIVLIKLLIENRSRYLSVNQISNEVCISENDALGNNVVQLISRFKKKLKKQINSDKFFIQSSYGNGYRIK
ncbi:MAG: response regulator transcription factor [Campylobacterota bacterium]|nr:response regulator transcription factor [Campylobacterota bacterium]